MTLKAVVTSLSYDRTKHHNSSLPNLFAQILIRFEAFLGHGCHALPTRTIERFGDERKYPTLLTTTTNLFLVGEVVLCENPYMGLRDEKILIRSLNYNYFPFLLFCMLK